MQRALQRRLTADDLKELYKVWFAACSAAPSSYIELQFIPSMQCKSMVIPFNPNDTFA